MRRTPPVRAFGSRRPPRHGARQPAFPPRRDQRHCAVAV